MINPSNAEHREQFSRAADHAQQELIKFARRRSDTMQAYLGINNDAPEPSWFTRNNKYKRELPQGNLLQQAGLSHQIALAYGEPEFLVTARVPEQKGLCEKLEPALNRMAKLLNLGEVARDVAADSFFGYGIFKTGLGMLPDSAQAATGMEFGPCVWRVSQADFIYDITAQSWDKVAYVGDIYTMPLNEALHYYPDHADRLNEMTDMDRLDAPTVFPMPSSYNRPEKQVRLCDMYFPGIKVVATWVIENDNLRSLAEAPLAIRPYDGHWSGVYTVLNHLYSPDELVPVSQAESTKAIHYLFNQLIHLTSEQAVRAKYNPLYRAGQGGDREMQKIWDATDRFPVSVQDPSNQNFGGLEIPGPTQSQTNYLGVLQGFFKAMTPTLDEPERAPTATQGTIARQTTNAITAEARRKFNRCLQLVGYKLGHLLIEDDTLTLEASRPLTPGSDITYPVTWEPKSMDPRANKIDDLDVGIDPQSVLHRSAEERQAQLVQSTQFLLPIMQAAASGSPINVEKVLDTTAKYMNLPELRDWFEPVDPLYQMQAQNGRQSTGPRIGVGQYTRTNVSEKTDGGQLEQALSQQSDESGRAMPSQDS